MSVAVEGSKGAVWVSVETGEEEGFLPVNASQNDMLTVWRREKSVLKIGWILKGEVV